MKKIQKETSINQLALAMHNLRDATSVVDKKALERAIEPLIAVITDAFKKGGRIGVQHVKETLNG